MTVSSDTARISYAGDGSTTSFATSPMAFFDTSDLLVYVVTVSTGAAELLVENTDYTVSGGAGSTGTVSLAGGSSPYGAPASTELLVIEREVPRLQETDFVNNDASDAETIEDALDKLTMMAQQSNALGSRAVRQPVSDESDIAELPVATSRAGKYFIFDSNGDPDVVTPASGLSLSDTAAVALGATASAGVSGNASRYDHVHQRQLESFVIAASDETTALSAGTAKMTFRMPYAFTITAVRASLSTAQTSGNIFTVDVNDSGTTILSTKLTIDNGEKTSTTAATPCVISDTALADDASITIDIDQIGDGTAKGLKVTLIGRQSA